MGLIRVGGSDDKHSYDSHYARSVHRVDNGSCTVCHLQFAVLVQSKYMSK